METRSLGGVLLAFAGLVLLIAGFRGTLQKVWQDATGLGATSGAGKIVPTPALDSGAVTFKLPAGYSGTGNIASNPVPGSSVLG